MPRTENTKSVSLDLPPVEWQAWGQWCRERGLTIKQATLQALRLFRHCPAGLRELASQQAWDEVEQILAAAEKRAVRRAVAESVAASGKRRKARNAGGGPSA